MSATKLKPQELSAKQIACCQEHLVDLNATQAEIFFYDGSGITQLTSYSSALSNYDPQVSGSNVAWRAVDIPMDYELAFYDGSSATQLTSNSYNGLSPQISGSNIVWQTIASPSCSPKSSGQPGKLV